MSKTNKQKINELKQNLFERHSKEESDLDASNLAKELDTVAFNIERIPGKGTAFRVVKLKYDLESKSAVVVDSVVLDQKVIGLKYEDQRTGIEMIYRRLFKTQEREQQNENK